MACRSTTSDQALARAWQRGDARAGSRLLERYVPLLDAYFRARTRGTEHEDLRQQALFAATKAIGGYRHEAPFRAFLLSIARFTLAQQRRASARGKGRLRAATTSLDDGLEPSSSPRLDESLDVDRAMRELDPGERALIEAHYLEGRTNVELGRRLRIPSGTAQDRRTRALRKMERRLRDR